MLVALQSVNTTSPRIHFYNVSSNYEKNINSVTSNLSQAHQETIHRCIDKFRSHCS